VRNLSAERGNALFAQRPILGQAHDFASEYGSSHHALRAIRDGLQPPLPAYPAWLERLTEFDPSRVFFAHDCSVWKPA